MEHGTWSTSTGYGAFLTRFLACPFVLPDPTLDILYLKLTDLPTYLPTYLSTYLPIYLPRYLSISLNRGSTDRALCTIAGYFQRTSA
jgi:hypothetical protein